MYKVAVFSNTPLYVRNYWELSSYVSSDRMLFFVLFLCPSVEVMQLKSGLKSDLVSDLRRRVALCESHG